MNIDLLTQVLSLETGAHLCLFYDRDPVEQRSALVPFIGQGLSQNDRVNWMLSQLKRTRVAREVTERKHAEEAQVLLAAIVDHSDDAIIGKDLEGVIQTWNLGAERLFGYTAAEAVGRPVTLLIPADRLDEEPDILHRIRRGKRVEHYETVRRRKDGSLVDISLTVSPIKNPLGKVVGASKIARDISDRVRAHQQLEQAVAERTASLREAVAQMEEFSYTVSHDLRAPLRSMRAYAQVLLEDYGANLPAEAATYLHRIDTSAQRLDRMILDVLTFCRPEDPSDEHRAGPYPAAGGRLNCGGGPHRLG